MGNGMPTIRWGLMLLALVGWQSVSAQTVVKYIHTDAFGSVVAITDENRNVIERREYEPYGEQLTPAVQDGPGYTGHVQDAATGLVYMQERYYDSELGVFLSVDPVAAHGSGDYRHFNRYAYAFNNPYRFTDPDGRAPVVPLAIAAGRCASNSGCRAASCRRRSAGGTGRSSGDDRARGSWDGCHWCSGRDDASQ